MDCYDEYLLQCGIIDIRDYERIMAKLEQEEQED